jgi:hypothetical protein
MRETYQSSVVITETLSGTKTADANALHPVIERLWGEVVDTVNDFNPDFLEEEGARTQRRNMELQRGTTVLQSLDVLRDDTLSAATACSTLKTLNGEMLGDQASHIPVGPNTLLRLHRLVEDLTKPSVDHLISPSGGEEMLWPNLDLTTHPPPRCSLDGCRDDCPRQMQIQYMASLPDARAGQASVSVNFIDIRFVHESVASALILAHLASGDPTVIIDTPGREIPFKTRSLEMLFGSAPDMFEYDGVLTSSQITHILLNAFRFRCHQSGSPACNNYVG